MKFSHICSMLGNPNFFGDPYQQHTEQQLAQLRKMNVNTVFVNIAWSRAWLDAVNLEHVAVSKRFPLLSDMQELEKYRRSFGARVQAVKASGMKAFALFGAPRYFDFSRYPESYGVLKGSSTSTIALPGESVACVNSPEVRQLYRELLSDLLERVPELDGIQLYTYDQFAEVCDEDSDCPRCQGVPAEVRIPSFLNELYAHLQKIKPGFELWWEPWELSAAQTYRIMERLDTEVGLALHSTLHEVYFVNETDAWFRNLAAIAYDQGRKVIGEIFTGGSGEDLGNVIGYPCPRLVHQQLHALARVPGVTGVKEYFGIVTEYASVNEEAMRLTVKDPTQSWQAVEQALSEAYAADDPARLRRFWEYAARAIEFIPWELSWVLRFSNLPPYGEHWGQRLADLLKTPWSTPSWLSNRRSFYLIVDNESNFTPRMQKDMIDRLTLSVAWLDKASEEARTINVREDKQACFALQQEAVTLFGYLVRSRLHDLQLGFLAATLRSGEPDVGTVANRMDSLLERELVNAEGFLDFLDRSEIPYTFRLGDGTPLEHSTILATIGRIQESRKRLSQNDVNEWLAHYF